MKALQTNLSIFKNFNRFVRQFRLSINAFSVSQWEKSSSYVFITSNSFNRRWPNSTLGPVDSVHPRYPLPGGVGFQDTVPEKTTVRSQFMPATHTLPSAREEQYASVLIETYNATELENTNATLIPPRSDQFECNIHTCPSLIKQDLVSIFPTRKFDGAPLSAIVLNHRTTEGLNQWSELAASEREQLAETFIKSAIDICASLKELGYWSDFINPYTGTPYLGAHGDAMLSETDEKMKHFGFELDDARCCKVLRHPRWKHHVFAGLIFTDAPRDHPVLAHF